MTFRYCVVPLTEAIGLPHAARAIREYLSPPWLATGSGDEHSFCSLDGDPAVTLTAIRARSQDDRAASSREAVSRSISMTCVPSARKRFAGADLMPPPAPVAGTVT